MTKIKWNQYEEALLIHCYILLHKGKYTRNYLINALSSCLRTHAINSGQIVDDKYRNVNGISMKFGNIEHLFTNGINGLYQYSTMDKKMYYMYIHNRKEFLTILKEALNEYELDV